MPEIANPQLRGAVDHLITQVNPENVFAVRRVLMSEVASLKGELDKYSVTSDYRPTAPVPGRMGTPAVGLQIGRCSDDPVSGPAQISFQRKIDGHVANFWRYVHDLNAAGEILAETARRYGITEDEIAESFPRIQLP